MILYYIMARLTPKKMFNALGHFDISNSTENSALWVIPEKFLMRISSVISNEAKCQLILPSRYVSQKMKFFVNVESFVSPFQWDV